MIRIQAMPQGAGNRLASTASWDVSPLGTLYLVLC